MKIREIHISRLGVLGTQSFDFSDEWSGETASRILISGPNGCGKTTLISVVAIMWNMFGFWLNKRAKSTAAQTEAMLKAFGYGSVVLVLEDLPYLKEKLLLVNGDENSIGQIKKAWPGAAVVGELMQFDKKKIVSHVLELPQEEEWFTQWTLERQRMLVSPEPSRIPNLIFLDADSRRWVVAKGKRGEIKPEVLQQRWISRYRPTERGDGQLEESLLSVKTASNAMFERIVDAMNGFLVGKLILKTVVLGENRIQVLTEDGEIITLDDLSSGEHQVLILLFQLGRWMEKGGIVLIDEPDLYLHPSLAISLLARIEQIVDDNGGQLIITSHMPDVWSRYETVGHRVLLGGTDES
ncbi:putative ATPase [Pseudomonas sp. EB276 TE3739]|uniref:ATP-binding protein n=1 Tax=Pseudomonas TaxID=286 RepID=UPI0020A018DF|nr:ATP-binding protein [Pseudomonas koreensis]MCP1474397.1 putative ATPase [Pseudomonas koreensis]